jgi:hypothetical protein
MRLLVALIAMLSVVACSKADRPEIEKIEIRQSGWQSEDVTITSTGLGNYHVSEPYPEGQSGTFKMTHEQFVSFLSGLEPYRAEAEPYTDESALRFIKYPCPPKVPRTTDAGAMYIRWRGPEYDMHFLMDFGCDAKRHAKRNNQLRRTIERLPVPRY